MFDISPILNQPFRTFATAKNAESPEILKIKKEREEKTKERVKEIMSRLDFSKHDKRNSKSYVEDALKRYYSKNPNNTIITPAQWDEMFSHYTPYRGTY